MTTTTAGDSPILEPLRASPEADDAPGRLARPPVSLQTLRGVTLFQDLSAERLQALAQACTWHAYEAGYTIPASYTAGFCVVATGRVLITTYEESGREVAFQVMGPGDCFGAVAILLGPGYDESVEAVTMQPSLVAQLETASFLAMLREDPAFAMALLQNMAHAVRRFSQRIVELSTLTVRGRLHAALLRMAHRVGVQANQARLEPSPRHQVLANYIGTNREQVTRELSWLQRQGLAAKDGKALLLLDIVRLQALVDSGRLKG